jgi:hypothetical protein
MMVPSIGEISQDPGVHGDRDHAKEFESEWQAAGGRH